jgi:hypothetical protein
MHNYDYHFFPDSWILGNAPASTDDAKSTIMLGIFVLFMTELFVTSWCQDGYAWSMLFWLNSIGISL